MSKERTITLSEADWNEFQRALDGPAAPVNKRLRELLRSKSPWDAPSPPPAIPLEMKIGEPRYFHADILRLLAVQLGIGNDFYYPLLEAAKFLEDSRSPEAKK